MSIENLTEDLDFLTNKRTDKRTSENLAMDLTTFVTENEIKHDVSINPVDLDEELISHPSKYVHYALKTVQARKQYDTLKNRLEILESTLDTEIREQFLSEGKKTTEAQIKSSITADPRYVELSQLVIDAKGIFALCEVAENAFLQRKDLLLEVARDRRKEKEGAMRVMESQNLRDNVSSMLKTL